ncbi:thiol-activated cytolysin [Aquimarina amphilecti]|uniref:Thiol-activated cytolysin n=1 Tax=Aquimarina amphilecti TaxID=1038014 RepID=A0A1H7N1S0_AQUAM|nr:thiol-activated cytolysin family protein [Aquimarina amphilecti]SEL16958.1 thiol-activated cytolysin [Aquimarina amphilecti]
MKTHLFTKGLLAVAIGVTTIVSCTKDEILENETESINESNPTTISAKVIDLGTGDDSFFDVYPESRETKVIETTQSKEDREVEENGSMVTKRIVCTTEKVSVEDGSTNFQLFGGLTSDVVFPGNLLQGKTVVDPEIVTPSIIPVKRAGGTISINVNGGVGTPSVTVDEVKTSTIQSAINQIINSASGEVPANFNLSIEQIESERQLALEMGLTFEGWKAKVESSFKFSTEKQFNRTLVKLTQTFYTINFDTPTRPEDIFASDVTQEEYKPYIDQNNPATFISSVAYGRIFYMLVESTSSRQEMQTQLNFAYDGFGTSTQGSLDVSAFQSLKDLKITVVAYGGDASGAITLAGENSVNKIAQKLAEGTKIETASPLSYKVRSVYEPSRVVGVKLGTEFDVVNCEVKGVLPPEAYRGMVDIFEDGIGAMVRLKYRTILLYNLAGDKYAFYNIDLGKKIHEGIFDHNDPNAPLGVMPLDGVRAAYLETFESYRYKGIHFFDMSGTFTATMRFDPSTINSTAIPQNIGATYSQEVRQPYKRLLGSGDGFDKINGEAIDAASSIYSGTWNPTHTINNFYMVEGRIRADRHRKRGRGYWWDDRKSVNTQLIKSVGAIVRFTEGNDKKYMGIDTDGETMIIWTHLKEAEGPFVMK